MKSHYCKCSRRLQIQGRLISQRDVREMRSRFLRIWRGWRRLKSTICRLISMKNYLECTSLENIGFSLLTKLDCDFLIKLLYSIYSQISVVYNNYSISVSSDAGALEGS